MYEFYFQQENEGQAERGGNSVTLNTGHHTQNFNTFTPKIHHFAARAAPAKKFSCTKDIWGLKKHSFNDT